MKYDLVRTLENERNHLEQQIGTYNSHDLQHLDPEELSRYLIEEYWVVPPELIYNDFSFDEKPARVDVRHDPRHEIWDRSKPVYVEGLEVTYHLPFRGQPELFESHANVIYMNGQPSPGIIRGSEILLSYKISEFDVPHVERRYRDDLALIERDCRDVYKLVIQWNDQLSELMRSRVEARRSRISQLASTLSVPLRKRPEGESYPGTGSNIRRKVLPPVSHDNPYLDLAQYEDILGTIEKVGRSFERAPSVFARMGEENLRNQFLVPLNVNYEDGTGAEVFNFQGKTDILIRYKGSNIFIAECKFWKGQKSLQGAIDQLLGYTTWRDTKTALLVFNRTRNFSSVLARIPKAVNRHPAFVAQQEYPSESGFRFVLQHPDDKQRRILLTVLAFEVPGEPMQT